MSLRNIWMDGMMGLVTGDALGNPVQFMTRDEVRARGPVCGMEAGGVYNTPAGTWTDDSSMALATLDSIHELGAIVPEDIMLNFVRWEENGAYTPFGQAFDEGNTCIAAIMNFARHKNWKTCGKTGEYANGNGALMRILPVCLYLIEQEQNEEQSHGQEDAPGFAHKDFDDAVKAIHQVTSLTHNHRRAMMASGLYYFMAREIVLGQGTLTDRLQKGLDSGFEFYRQDIRNLTETARFGRLTDLSSFAALKESEIKSSGYVIDTLEAAVWSLVRTDSFSECLLTAVNLGDDADTVGAVAGGLAGLYYGVQGIPADWLDQLQKRSRIEDLCTWDYRSPVPVTDIHAHLIPGIDDGSRDIEMTMEMIRSACRQGVTGILLTPHADGLVHTDALKKGWDEIRRRCAEEYPDLVLGMGSEIFLTPGDMDDCIEGLRLGSILSLNDTKYVLTEFYQRDIPFEDIKTCVTQLIGAGWIPVIAHAERYIDIYRSMDDVRWLKDQGCLIQINLFSAASEPSREMREFTGQMIREKLVDFLGTDAHRMDHRPPKIANGMKALLEMSDPAYVRKIAYENAEQLLYHSSTRHRSSTV